MRLSSILAAGISIIAATTAAASSGQVFYRYTADTHTRQVVRPSLVFNPAANLLLGGFAVSDPSRLTASAPISLQATAGDLRACDALPCESTDWRSSILVRPGQFVQARMPAPLAPGQTVRMTVAGDGLQAAFEASSRSTAPSFTAVPAVSVDQEQVVESPLSTFTGWVETPINVVGGRYRVCGSVSGCGSFTGQQGVIRHGDQVQLEAIGTAFAGFGEVVVNAGGASLPWSIETLAAPLPDTFTIAERRGVEPASTVVSNAITVSGFNGEIPLSITGGVDAGVAVLPSETYVRETTIRAGQSFRVRATTASEFATSAISFVSLGDLDPVPFTIVTRDRNETPNPIAAISPLTEQEPGQVRVLSSYALTGHDGITITVAGDGIEYRLCDTVCAPTGDTGWTSDAGYAAPGAHVQIRLTAGAFGTTRVSSLRYGTRRLDLTISTREGDDTPDVFSFPTVSDTTPGTFVMSSAAHLTGHDGVPLTISGHPSAVYQVCATVDCAEGGPWTSLPGAAPASGAFVRVGVTPDQFSVNVEARLHAGRSNAAFVVATRVKNTTPDAFVFNPLVPGDVHPQTLVMSRPARLSGHDGVDVAISSSAANAAYQICSTANCTDQTEASWTSAPSTDVPPGSYVRVRMRSGAFGETTAATLSAGTTASTFTIRARTADLTPDPFSFQGVSNAGSGVTEFTSEIVQITGHEGVSASIAGGGAPQFRVCADAGCATVKRGYSNASASLVDGDYVQLKAFKANIVNNNAAVTLTAGTASGTWAITTQARATTCVTFGGSVPGCSQLMAGPGSTSVQAPTANFRIISIGGGAGGGAGSSGGGGSGEVTFSVCTGGAARTVRVGAGGAPGQPGEPSGVDGCFTAAGGQVNFFEIGGAGGSGGGGTCGAGGSGGSNGGACDGTGGDGQGPSFRSSFGNFNLNQITFGDGGAAGSDAGGGGGGLVVGAAPGAQNGSGATGAKGGTGYGAGGGGGGASATGGRGAPGFIYVEW